MPFLLLLIAALSSGFLAAFLTRLYSRRTVAAVLLGGTALALLAVAARSTDFWVVLDTRAADWGDRHATAWSRDAITLVTRLGEMWTVLPVAVLVAAVELHRSRNRWVVPFLFAVIAGGSLLTEAFKQLFDRARPELEPVAATLGPSFPSGHTATAAASWAAFAFLASRWWGPRARPALAGAAVGIAVAVAASRVLLDVHWLTDVLAGLALGWGWFAVCAFAFAEPLLDQPFPGKGPVCSTGFPRRSPKAR